MVVAGIIAFREGLEAALIVGIVLSYLNKTGRGSTLSRHAWAGVGVAVGASITLAALLQLIGARLEGRLEQVFEGTTMLLAALVLTWMIFWMRYQARHLRHGAGKRPAAGDVPQRHLGDFRVDVSGCLSRGGRDGAFFSRQQPSAVPVGASKLGRSWAWSLRPAWVWPSIELLLTWTCASSLT